MNAIRERNGAESLRQTMERDEKNLRAAARSQNPHERAAAQATLARRAERQRMADAMLLGTLAGAGLPVERMERCNGTLHVYIGERKER